MGIHIDLALNQEDQRTYTAAIKKAPVEGLYLQQNHDATSFS